MISELFGFNSVLLIESLDTAAGCCSLLLTRVERVALGTDFHVDILLRGTGHKRVATVACHSCLIILRMDSFLHDFHLFFFDRELRPGSSAAHPPHVFLTHSPRPFPVDAAQILPRQAFPDYPCKSLQFTVSLIYRTAYR